MINDSIVVTPLLGGRQDGGVCSLLEVGGARILLDCGCTMTTRQSDLLQIAQTLAKSGGVDCVLLSHADVHHMGALPVIFGSQGLPPVPIICTLPVAKFGQMLLYDMCLNMEMEGIVADESAGTSSNPQTRQLFGLDDIDRSLSKIVTVRYSQNIPIPESSSSSRSSSSSSSSSSSHMHQRQIHCCAVGAGRTIGGAIWRIRHGATEILYMMDINLRKEIVLDGAALDLLPSSPALLIIEGGCASRAEIKFSSVAAKKRQKGEDTTGIVEKVMDTLRMRGSALIPCESASRMLELLQILGKYWIDHRISLDHLIFLSPMAHNILEFARSQIEWMNEVLSKQFIQYGRLNPFELPPLKLVTSLRELEKLYPGPKVVLATDASLSCGMGKELLLRWGGNPLCRVILTDSSDAGTLAQDLRSQLNTPPIVASVYRPQRVELVGEELAVHQREQDRKRREREEIVQRRKREEELAALTAAGRDDQEDEEADEWNTTRDSAETSGESANESTAEPAAKRQKANQVAKKSAIARFAAPSFPMFQTRDTTLPIDEYGTSISDLKLLRPGEEPNAAPAGPRQSRMAAAAAAPGSLAQKAAAIKGQQQQDRLDELELQEVPWKLVSTKLRVQFTCDFKSVPVGGRADLKAIKTVLQRVTPARVLVMRGSAEDCDVVKSAAQTVLPNAETFAPACGQGISFNIRADRISLYLPPALLPKAMREIRNVAVSGQESVCTICAIGGTVAESTDTTKEGVRVLRMQASTTDSVGQTEGTSMVVLEDGAGGGFGAAAGQGDGEGGDEMALDDGVAAMLAAPVDLIQPAIGMISAGEVSLNALKIALEKSGLAVESFAAVSSGSVRAYLLCEQQVIIRKDNENDFVVEGPPVPAFWAARKVLYRQFAVV